MNKYIDAKAIKSRLKGSWLNAYITLAPQLTNAVNRAGKHCSCPVHGGTHGDAFRIDDKNMDGAAYCNTCGSFLDGIEVLKWVNNWTFRETIEHLDNYLNGNNQPFNQSNNQPVINKRSDLNQPDIEKRRKSIERIIKESSKTPLESHLNYLFKRGLKPIESPSLRYHAGLPYYFEGKPVITHDNRYIYYPCIVGVYKGISGITGISRIYLDKAGNKAGNKIKSDLLSMGINADNTPEKVAFKIESLSGSAVRLGSIGGETVAVCEGIETGIALRNAGLESVLACTTATLMQSVLLPDNVRNVLIYADYDDAGLNAANKLKARLDWCNVKVVLPPTTYYQKRGDWLDAITAGHKI